MLVPSYAIRSIACLLIFVAPVLAQTTTKRRVALVDFDASAVKTTVARDVGPGYDIGKTVSQALLSPLIESGAFEVLDRARMQTLFHEQNVKYSDRFDASQAVSYGRLLSVDAIVTGVVNSVVIELKKKTKGLAGIGRKITVVHAMVDITSQVISTETSQIYAAPSATGDIEEEIASETASSIRIPGIGNRTVQPGTTDGAGSVTVRNNLAEPALRKAISVAVDKIAKEMIAKAPDLPRRTPTPLDKAMKYSNSKESSKVAANAVSGSVVDVEGHLTFVDVGTEAGLKKGERLEIRRFLRNATSKGKTIKLDRKIGVVEITEVQQGWSSGTFSGEGTPLKGDRVVREQ